MTVFHGDCRDVIAQLGEASIDAVVCDPPYSWSFMGKSWDSHANPVEFQTWCHDWAAECFRVLKPGGHLLAFGGPRSYHRLACGVEDAGFDIRESFIYMFGSGFPKSLSVSAAIDKKLGAERTEVIGVKAGHEDFVDRTDAHAAGGRSDGWDRPWREDPDAVARSHMQFAPATPEAERWEGWGTALKPAYEPVVVARKPLIGSVAENVLTHGTGGLNIDGCRVDVTEPGGRPARAIDPKPEANGAVYAGRQAAGTGFDGGSRAVGETSQGRWPTNVIFGHSDSCVAVESGDGEVWECAQGCPVAVVDAQSGDRKAGASISGSGPSVAFKNVYGDMERRSAFEGYGDTGGASRFFTRAEWADDEVGFLYTAKAPSFERPVGPDGTQHPTVKPLKLLTHLVRMVTPPGGTVLDPFAGSGTTIEAAIIEGFNAIGIELTDDYLPLIDYRIQRGYRGGPSPKDRQSRGGDGDESQLSLF